MVIETGFSGGPVVRNLPCNAGDTSSIPGPGRSCMLGGNWVWEPQLLNPPSLEPVIRDRGCGGAVAVRSPWTATLRHQNQRAWGLQFLENLAPHKFEGTFQGQSRCSPIPLIAKISAPHSINSITFILYQILHSNTPHAPFLLRTQSSVSMDSFIASPGDFITPICSDFVKEES